MGFSSTKAWLLLCALVLCVFSARAYSHYESGYGFAFDEEDYETFGYDTFDSEEGAELLDNDHYDEDFDEYFANSEASDEGLVLSDDDMEKTSDDLMDCSQPVDTKNTKDPVTWQQWRRLLKNARVLRGLIFGMDGPQSSDLPMFKAVEGYPLQCVPNEPLSDTDYRSDFKSYRAHSELASKYMHEGFLDIAITANLPGVSATTEIKKSEKQIQTKNSWTTYFVVTHLETKAVFNIISLLKRGILQLDPDFKSLVKQTAEAKGPAQHDLIKQLREQFGLVWANKITVGGSLFVETSKEVKSQSEEEETAQSIKVSVSATYQGFGGGTSTEKGDKNSKFSSSKTDTSTGQLSARGGNTALSAEASKWKESVNDYRNWAIISYTALHSIADLLDFDESMKAYKTGLKNALKASAKEGDKNAQANALPKDSALTGDDALYSTKNDYRLWFTKVDGKANVAIGLRTADGPQWTSNYPGTEQLTLTVGGSVEFADAGGKRLGALPPIDNVDSLKLQDDGTLVVVDGKGAVLRNVGWPREINRQGALNVNNFVFAYGSNGDRYGFGLSDQGLELRRYPDSYKDAYTVVWNRYFKGRDFSATISEKCRLVVTSDGNEKWISDDGYSGEGSDRCTQNCGSCVLRVGEGEAYLDNGGKKAWTSLRDRKYRFPGTTYPREVVFRCRDDRNGPKALTLSSDYKSIELMPYVKGSPTPNQIWAIFDASGTNGIKERWTTRVISLVNPQTDRQLIYQCNNCPLGSRPFDGVQHNQADEKGLFNYWDGPDGKMLSWTNNFWGQTFDTHGGWPADHAQIYSWNRNGDWGQIWIMEPL